MRYPLFRNTLVALLLLASLMACSSPPEKQESFPIVQMAPVSPPLVLPEEWVHAEDPTEQIWRPGYWSYNGIDFTWNPGRLIMRPDPTAIWSSDRWEMRTYGWAFVPGYWQ